MADPRIDRTGSRAAPDGEPCPPRPGAAGRGATVCRQWLGPGRLPEPRARALAARIVACALALLPPQAWAQDDALVFGSDQDYPPYEYLNERGEPIGFTVDLVRALARELGEPIAIRLGPWPAIFHAFEVEGSVDFLDLFYTPERAVRVEYTTAFAVVYDEVFVRREAPRACAYEDLAGKEVIVQRASTTEEHLSRHARGARLMRVPSEPAALRLLAAGFHDCAIVTSVAGRLAIKKYGLAGLVTSGEPVRPRDYAFAVHKENLALRDRLNAALAALKASGEFQRIYDRWFGELEPPTAAQAFLRAYGGWVLLAVLLVSAGVFGWNRALAVRVDERTKALGAATQRLKDLFDNANDAIFLVDPDTGRILDANRRASERYGYSRAELLAMRVHELGAPDEAGEVTTSLERLSAAGHAMIERTHRRKNGAPVDVEISARVIEIDGRRVAEAFVRDISERKCVERERGRLAGELARSNAELEAFVYTISHDLKAPLITIGGFARLAERDLAAGDRAHARDSLGEICNAAGGMQALIEDLLALSRIGHIVGEREPVAFGELMAEVLARLRAPIASTGAQVSVIEPMPALRVDRMRFVQVMQNLVDNAIKFHREGVAPQVEIGALGAEGECRLYVRDNGVGIGEKYREKIFELFQRLDTRIEGTGVGLTIVRRIVELHDGRVWVESESGRGSTFWIALPDSVIVARPAPDHDTEGVGRKASPTDA